MAKRFRTHYDNLHIDRDASPEAIRAAYRSLCKQYHPDRNTDPDANRIMSLLNRSYAVLSDPEQRRHHDEWIAQQSAPQPESPISSPMPPEKRRRGEPLPYYKIMIWLAFLAIVISSLAYLAAQQRKLDPLYPQSTPVSQQRS